MYFIYHNLSFFSKTLWYKSYGTTILLILTLSFFFVFILLNQIGSKNKFYNINYKRNLILFAVLNFAGYLFLFYNTHWGYNGIRGDNFYRTAYITKMYYSGYPQDFAYKDLSAFYAPFYWYCLALIAILFQIAPYKMIRVGILITCTIIPITTFEMWKKIYNEKLAFVITIVSTNIYIIYDIDHVIAGLLFIPFFMYYFENCTEKKFSKKNYISAGLIGSILFCTYFLYFMLIPIYYFISLIQNKNRFKENLKHVLLISLSLISFSSWFWIPVLKDILLIGFESHQNRYIWSKSFTYPIFTVIGFNSSIIGLVYIIWRYKLSRDIKILGNLFLSLNIAFLLGFIGILIGFPIMHIRLIEISSYILWVSSSIFYVRFFLFLADNGFLKRNKLNINLYQIEIYFLISIMIANLYAHWYFTSQSYIYQAVTLKPSYLTEVREIFEELDYEDKVFLTNEWGVAALIPIYLFLLPDPYFTHPSALYNQRVKFLIELS